MRSKRKWLALAGALVMAVAALAANATRAQASVAPSNCFQDMYLVELVNNLTDQINSSGDLYFADPPGGGHHDLCQARVSSGSSAIVIYTSSSGDCLAFDATHLRIYQHNPTGCVTTGTPPAYEQWIFNLVSAQPGDSKLYTLESLYNGECLGTSNSTSLSYLEPCSDSTVAVLVVDNAL